MRAGVEAVLLDIDDTLVDTREGFAAGMRAVAGTYLGHLGDGGPTAALQHWVSDPGGHFAAFTRGEVTFEQQRRSRAERLHLDLGAVGLDGPGFARWNRTFEDGFRDAWVALPGAAELVAALGATNPRLPFGAVTNAEVGYQRDKLERTGLGAVPVLVGTDTLGLGKPDPRVFHHGCALLGVDPGGTVYVGNDLVVDAQAAVAAGLQGVWFDRGHDPVPAAPPSGLPVVRSLTELIRWLAPDGGFGRSSGAR
ncbi:MAG: HAD family hydrolase [Actinomycetota bacterium]